MISAFRHFLGWLCSAFGSRKDLVLENLALRQQLLALHTKRPHRRLSAMQKLFWVLSQRFWSGWQKPLVLVTPRTVVEWHRAGFRLYLGLAKDTPAGRPTAMGSAVESKIRSFPRLGGLHHRYAVAA